MFELMREARLKEFNAALESDKKPRFEKLEDTVFIYHKKVGPYWVLCDKYDWPTVWLPKSMEKEESSYYILIDGEPYRFGWYMQGKRMRNMHEVSDLAPSMKNIKNNEVPPELLEISKGKHSLPQPEETPESFYERKELIDKGEEPAMASKRATFEEIAISAMAASEKVERLKEIQEEMIDLLREAYSIVRQTDESERFRLYPYGNIMSMLGSDEYPEQSFSFAEIIKNLENEEIDVEGLSKERLIKLWKDSMNPHKDVDLTEKQLDKLDEALRKHGVDPETIDYKAD
jgi:hypothetical protein